MLTVWIGRERLASRKKREEERPRSVWPCFPTLPWCQIEDLLLFFGDFGRPQLFVQFLVVILPLVLAELYNVVQHARVLLSNQ